jgi:hypothetical protein
VKYRVLEPPGRVASAVCIKEQHFAHSSAIDCTELPDDYAWNLLVPHSVSQQLKTKESFLFYQFLENDLLGMEAYQEEINIRR